MFCLPILTVSASYINESHAADYRQKAQHAGRQTLQATLRSIKGYNFLSVSIDMFAILEASVY